MKKLSISLPTWKQLLVLAGAFVVGVVLMAVIGSLLVNIQQKQDEAALAPLPVAPIAKDELDPHVWGKNFPREYSSFRQMEDRTISTPYGGSVPIDKLERFPILKKLWAGYAFSVDFNEVTCMP
jgi:nitrite reductase (cytochrome c-552)